MTLVKLGLKLSPLLRRSVFIGRLAFRISIWYKRSSLILGRWSQRAIEYPWLLSVLDKFVPPGSKVLDVGCAESALSHETSRPQLRSMVHRHKRPPIRPQKREIR